MRLIDWLRSPDAPAPTGVPGIKSWRVYMVERREADVAIRRAIFGGPYCPPALRSSTTADVFIQWADGKCSQSALNRSQLESASEALQALYALSYPDPFPEHVPGQTALPDLRVCVPEVKEAVLYNPSALVEPMMLMATELRSLPTDQIRATFSADHARVTFMSSQGADSTHETTGVQYGATISSRAMMVHDLRRLPRPDQVQVRLHRVRQDYELLGKPFEGALRQPKVYLTPALTRQFLNYYLLQNLSMQAILNGASAFTRQQLEEESLLFHSSLNIIDHPRRDEHPSAFRLCQRGQAPLERPLVKDGRLAGVDVNLRAATQGGIDPTPTSLTENWIIDGLEPADELTGLDRDLSGLDNAILLYSVLGLHTSDAVRGAYSLGVPRALVVEDGQIKGFVRGTVVGNFFEDLRSPLSPRRDPLAEVPILPLQASFVQG